MKPYYEQDGIAIYHGDCREVIGWLRPPHVFVTDPPYGFGHYETDKAAFEAEHLNAMVASGTTAVFGYPETLVAWCVAAGVVPDEWITWWATNKAGRSTGLMRESECVAIFGVLPGRDRVTQERSGVDRMTAAITRGRGLSVDRRRAGDVWRASAPGMAFNAHQRQHPNEKPLSVVQRLVDLCSDPGDVIVDPFMGSGTTLRAAKDLNRRAIGIEIEERYCEIAAKRLGQMTLDLAA